MEATNNLENRDTDIAGTTFTRGFGTTFTRGPADVAVGFFSFFLRRVTRLLLG